MLRDGTAAMYHNWALSFHIAAGNVSLSCYVNEGNAQRKLRRRHPVPPPGNYSHRVKMNVLKGWCFRADTLEGEPRCYKTEDGFIFPFSKKMCIVFHFLQFITSLAHKLEGVFNFMDEL